VPGLLFEVDVLAGRVNHSSVHERNSGMIRKGVLVTLSEESLDWRLERPPTPFACGLPVPLGAGPMARLSRDALGRGFRVGPGFLGLSSPASTSAV
jgi:hypothetical protein